VEHYPEINKPNYESLKSDGFRISAKNRRGIVRRIITLMCSLFDHSLKKAIQMKAFISVFLVFMSFHAACQKDGFEISTSGLDSIKIGMSKGDVEKVLKTSLQLYDGSTSTIKDQDSAITKWGCNN
jgi:hypothetical protein